MTIVINEKDRGNSKPDGSIDFDLDFENDIRFQAWLKNYISNHQSQNQSQSSFNVNNNNSYSNSSSNAIANGGSASSYSTSSGGNASVTINFDPLVNYLQRWHVQQMYAKGHDFVFNTPFTTNFIQGSDGYLQGTEGSDRMVGGVLDTSILFGAESGDILTGGGSLIGGKGQDLLIGQGATYFEVQGGDMIVGWEQGSLIGFSKPLSAADDIMAVDSYALFDGDRIAGVAILRNGFTTAFVAGASADSINIL